MNTDLNYLKDLNDLKGKGNACMQIREYSKAIEFYTQAIEGFEKNKCENCDLNSTLTLMSNRAEAFLKLGYFHSALKDCNNILSSSSISNSNPNLIDKTLYRKARALEHTGDLTNALSLYEELLNKFLSSQQNDNDNKQNDKNKDQELTIQLTDKISTCKIKQQNTAGLFHTPSLITEENNLLTEIKEDDYKYNTHSKEFKFADYLNNKIETTFNKTAGVTLISKQEIKEGELLIVEKPLVYIIAQEYERFKYELNEEIYEEKDQDAAEDDNSFIYDILLGRLKRRIQFPDEKDYLIKQLSSLYNGSNLKKNLEERSSNFDTQEIRKIISSNGLLSLRNSSGSNSGFDYKDVCFGLWVYCSFFNHSCLPNSFYFGIGPYLVVKAIRPISVNEEITISYIEPKSYEERQFSLSKWNFTCKCPLCKEESNIHKTDNYLYITKKIDKLKFYLTKNRIASYSQLNTFFTGSSNDKLLNKFAKWVENVEKKTEEIKAFYYIRFLFYKFYSIVFSYTERKEYYIRLFEKCYEISKQISIRESYEILNSKCELFNNDMEKDFLLENKELERLNKILYEVQTV